MLFLLKNRCTDHKIYNATLQHLSRKENEVFHQLRVLNSISNPMFYFLNSYSIHTTFLFCLDCNELLNKIFLKRPIKKPGCPVVPQRSCPVAGLFKGKVS